MYGRMMTGVALAALLAQPALAQTEQQQPAQDQQQLQQQQQPAQDQQQVQQQQDTQQQQGTQPQELAQADLEFAQKAAEGGLKEVQLGELAQQQAENQQVQQFGQRMVEDHGQANERLMSIAQQKGIDLPQELPQDAQQTYEELQQQSGAEFDQAYMDEMVSDHEQDVQEYEQYVQEGQDPDLRAFAEETLPVLQEHLQLAQQTQQQVVAGGDQAQPQATTAATQEQQPTAAQQEQQATQQQQQAATQEQTGQIQPQEVIGLEVMNAQGEEIGEINDIVLDQQQQPYAVISVGGWLGVGDRRVAVPLDELEVGQDEAFLMTNLTQEQIEQMPEFEEEGGMFQPATGTQQPGATGQQPATGTGQQPATTGQQ